MSTGVLVAIRVDPQFRSSAYIGGLLLVRPGKVCGLRSWLALGGSRRWNFGVRSRATSASTERGWYTPKALVFRQLRAMGSLRAGELIPQVTVDGLAAELFMASARWLRVRLATGKMADDRPRSSRQPTEHRQADQARGHGSAGPIVAPAAVR